MEGIMMYKYSGFLTVMGGLFLTAAALFLALTYIAKYPGYVVLGVTAVFLFIRWVRKFCVEPPTRSQGWKNPDTKTDREFDAWMNLNDN
jgi:hypothetical protein